MSLKSICKIIGLLILGMQFCTCQVKTFSETQSEFVFIENGQSLAPVILYENAPPRTVLAAKEFVTYIEKITGVKPELIIGNPSKIPQKAVWIGYQPHLKSIFPEINFELRQEEILLTANKNHLVILGRDKFEESLPQVKIKKNILNDFQKEYGTINAVYTFLQDYLEVRWFFPGDLGEDIIKKNRIAIKSFLFRYEPQIKARSGLFVKSRLGNNQKPTNTDKWAMKNRTYYSSVLFDAGHPFVDWWEKYNKSNPEIFALTTNLNRQPLRNPKYVKLCVSNTDIDKIWLDEVKMQIIQNPYKTIFSANENDGYGSGFCVCESCKKLDQGNALGKNMNLSDRHLHFVNRLANLLQENFPNKNYKVLYQAYGPDRALPIKEKPNQHVIVSSVANFHLRRGTHDFMNDPNVLEYYNWSLIAKEQFWRPNLSNPVGKDWGLPDIALNQLFEDFKWVAEQRCSGIFFDAYQDHWSTQGPQYYIAAQLAWNPYLDREKVLSDFYNRMYGNASIQMKQYWNFLENSRQQHFENHNNQYGRFFIEETYNSEWFKLAYSFLDLALNNINNSNQNEIFKLRIEFAKEGLAFTEKIVKIRGLMSQYEKNKKIEILNKIEMEWDEIEQLKKQMNPLSINFGYVKYLKNGKDSGSYSRRMTGLIPNKPITNKILRSLAKDEEGLE